MWNNETLQDAREQQLMINSSINTQKISKEQIFASLQNTIKDIENIQKLKMVSRITSKLANVTQMIRNLVIIQLDMYQLQNKNNEDISEVTQKVTEELRGAVYRMVAGLSANGVRVSVTNNKHRDYIQKIQDELKKISQLLHDDNIELEIDMDCSRDEDIARSLSGM